MNNLKKYIWLTVNVKIDRPINSKHPKHWFNYELNYWFVPDTISWDWEELDVYVMWVNEVIEEFRWRCIAIIHRLDDNDDKIIVVPDWLDFSDEEIIEKTNFQEQFFTSIIIR